MRTSLSHRLLATFVLVVTGWGSGLFAQSTYTVLPGDTFARIAREHGLSLSELQEANPGRSENLSPGDRITLPEPVVLAPVDLPSSKTKVHEVQAGETLYSISRTYGIAVAELERLNPGTANGLDIGETLVIRSGDGGVDQTVDWAALGAPDPNAARHVLPVLRQDTLRALVMLPFFLHADTVDGGGYDAKTTRLREISLEFLHGAQWAATMLRDSGYTVSLKVVDSEPDSLGVYSWSDSDLSWADVVLGPLRREALDSVNSLLSSSVIPQWVLTPQHPAVWEKHPLAFTLEAMPEIGMRELGRFAAESHPGETVLLIETRGKDAAMEEAFRSGFLAASGTDTRLKSIPANAQFCEGLIAELDTSKLNVIALPAGKPAQSLTAYIQTELQLADSFPVQLYGNADVLDFEFLERRFLERSQWTMAAVAGTLWSDAAVVQQIQTYRDRFLTDPSLYAFVACDALLESAKWQGHPWPVPASVYYAPRWNWDESRSRWMNHQWSIQTFEAGGWMPAR